MLVSCSGKNNNEENKAIKELQEQKDSLEKKNNELQEKELSNLYKLTNKDVPYELQQFSKENLSDNFLNNLFYFTFVFKYCK